MKKHALAALLLCACVRAGASASEQPPADCKPNSLNIPGAPYPCVHSDNRVMFRVVAPDAQKVRVRLPMIIVMDNLNAVKPGESAALYFARGALTQAVPEAPQPAGTVSGGRRSLLAVADEVHWRAVCSRT